jgi:hypothetical protein
MNVAGGLLWIEAGEPETALLAVKLPAAGGGTQSGTFGDAARPPLL